MLFARADWLTRKWLAKYYSPPSSRRETKWLRASLWVPKVMFWSVSYSTCVVYTKTIIHLSVGESGGYLPPLRWIIVKCSFVTSVEQTKNSENPTGAEPLASKIPIWRSNHWATRDSWWAWPFIQMSRNLWWLPTWIHFFLLQTSTAFLHCKLFKVVYFKAADTFSLPWNNWWVLKESLLKFRRIKSLQYDTLSKKYS